MPLSKTIHRDKPLENISIAYKPSGLIEQEISPVVKVKKESDQYYVYSRQSLAVPETLRANGAESNKATFDVSTSSYRLDEHSLHDDVTDRDRENADDAINLDVDTTEILTERILLRREVSCADMLFSTNNFSNSASLTSTMAWNQNTTLSNPITIVDSATAAIIQQSGKVPNILVTNDASFRGAKEHTSIIDRVKYTSADSVTETILAKLFTIDKLVVGRSVYNSADEGTGTDTMTFIWTNCAWLGYVERNAGLKKVSAIYTLQKYDEGSPYIVKKWREEKLGADRIEVSSMFQHKAVATNCAFLIRDTA